MSFEWIRTIKEESESSIVNHPLAMSLLKKYNIVFPKEIPFS